MKDLKTPPAEPETAAEPHANPIAWPLGLAGVALVIVGSFLSWSYDSTILGDLSINFYPGGLQILAIILALLALVLLLAEKGPLPIQDAIGWYAGAARDSARESSRSASTP